jgi:predicted permease
MSRLFEAVSRDVRYAVRMLRKTPGFTAVALITLGVGIGVNTAVFSIVNGLLLRPLPYPEPDRLAAVVTLSRSPRGENQSDSVDGKTFLAIHDNATTVDTAAAGGGFGGGVNLVANGVAANVSQQRVSAGYFAVLGVAPVIGREFNADDDRKGGAPAAILSYALWARVFGGDRNIVGRPIMLRGDAVTVVGVMPRELNAGAPIDLWTPLQPSVDGEGGGTNYGMIARLRSGSTWAQANAEVNQLGAAVARRGWRDDVSATCMLVPLQQQATAEIRRPLMMLWGAVGLVLLIAYINIAGLLIARASTRTREIATRIALGGGRGVIVRQLLIESAVLSLGGGALGVFAGWVVLRALTSLSADVFPLEYPVGLDARVLIIALVTALGTSVCFGLVPALQASRVDVQAVLAESGTRGVAGGQGRWARRLLIVGEVAMGVVLLVSAGLLLRTFVHLRLLNPGFDPASVTTATISLQDKRYEDADKVDRLFTDTLAGIRRQPGVEAAGVALGLPYTRLLNLGFRRVEGATPEDSGAATNVSYITPGYLEALRLPLRRGRAFTDADGRRSSPVAIVNEEFVRRFYKDRDVLGLHIRVVGADREIVGVVGNARATASGLGGDGSPLIVPFVVYVPAAQTTDGFLKLVHTWFSPAWVVRASGPVGGIAEGIRRSIAAADPMLPLAKVQTMTDVQGASLARQRFMVTIVVGLGAIALLLAAIGIHGLIASSVGERTREFGIRIALGATRGQVVAGIVMPGVALAGAGIAIGGAASVAAIRALQSFLWGVAPTDPVTLIGVVIVLLAVATLASAVPAWRLVRSDPARSLRGE